eukprot:122890-Pelagomonas_calceolata.AAC.3
MSGAMRAQLSLCSWLLSVNLNGSPALEAQQSSLSPQIILEQHGAACYFQSTSKEDVMISSPKWISCVCNTKFVCSRLPA